MNTEFINYCIKSVRRRWNSLLRAALSIFLVFAFVTGIMLFKSNMYQWQLQSAKQRFGNWIVMLYDSNIEENKELKNHPYLNESGKASIDNYVYEEGECTDIKVGYMTDEFLRIGNISLQCGRMPEKDDEAAIEWDSLIKLNQGTQIGQEIHIEVRKGSSQTTETIEKTYKLTGILNNYTNVWNGGEYIPGIVVTEGEGEAVNRIGKAAYIYSSNNYINNYRDIYDGLVKKTHKELIYNSSVYDYKPWAGGYVYDYMYVLLMIIGVSAIIHQVLVHSRERETVRNILANIGAKKIHILALSFIENVVIIVVAATAGLIFSIITGSIICSIVSNIKGIQFFNIESSIYVYVLIMLGIALVTDMLAEGIVNTCNSVNYGYKRKKKKKRLVKITQLKLINKNNYIGQTSRRLRKSQGAAVNIAIRVFALLMCVIIIGCAANSIKAYRRYQDIDVCSDIIAFNKTDKSTNYILCYGYKDYRAKDYYISEEKKKIWTRDNLKYDIQNTEYLRDINKEIYDKSGKRCYDNDPVTGKSRRYYNRFGSYELMYNVKPADTIMYKAIDNNIIDYINNIDGVEDVSYGYYETGRMWSWDNIDYNKLGLAWFEQYNFNSVEMLNQVNIPDKYLFAAEYVEAEADIYNILSEYVDKEKLDMEAFKKGEASVVFVDVNKDGEYDDTITEGTDINLMKYYCNINGTFAYDNSRYRASTYNKALSAYIKNNGYSPYSITDSKYDARGASNYINSLLVKPDMDELREAYINNLLYNSGLYMYSEFMNLSEEEQLGEIKNKYYEQVRKDCSYNMNYVPAATTSIISVVQLNDEIKDKLREYIPEFGQYTMLASTELLKNALDSQNKVLKDYFQLDELPEELTLNMSYNQIKLRYSLNSLYSGTVNAVNSYMEQLGWGYHSYSEEKDAMKSDTVETIILYGFTAFIAASVYIMISIMVLNNRINQYKPVMQLLRRSGADKRVVFNILMRDCIWQNLYCIILMPVMLLIEAIIIRKNVT